ncbi:MAG: ABC transporter substrate-binding protein [Actinobacteria bacterium]|nr:ABC transporter substrate-binding protein [Actinomycetota bacterium]
MSFRQAQDRGLIRRFIAVSALVLLIGSCGPKGAVAPVTKTGGGSLSVGTLAPGDLDPAKATTQSALLMLRTACDGLVGLDPETGKPRPALAKGWTFGKDSRSLVLDLRPKVKFVDDTPVDAPAIREALSRVVRPATASPSASLLSRIEGFQDVRSGQTSDLPGVTAVGISSIAIRFSEPSSDMVSVLADPALIPLSPKSVERDPAVANSSPPCAGPYKFQGVSDNSVTLTRATSSRSVNVAFTESGHGAADRIDFHLFASIEEAFDAFKAGTVAVSQVPDSRLVEARSLKGYARRNTPEMTYLAFDVTKPATADPRLRLAISLALDRLVLIDAAFGDQRQSATQWLPDETDRASVCSDSLHKIADTDRAKTIFASTGIDPAKSNLELIFDSSRISRLVAQAIEVQVKDAIRIDLKLQPLDPGGFGTSLAGHSASGIWIVVNDPRLPVPDDRFGALVRSGSPRNTMSFSDAQVDADIDSARAEVDPTRADVQWQQAENRICQLMPGAPLWFGVRHWVFSDAVHSVGSTRLDLFGTPILRSASRS